MYSNSVKDIVNLEALFMSLCNVIVINILKCIKPWEFLNVNCY